MPAQMTDYEKMRVHAEAQIREVGKLRLKVVKSRAALRLAQNALQHVIQQANGVSLASPKDVDESIRLALEKVAEAIGLPE